MILIWFRKPRILAPDATFPPKIGETNQAAGLSAARLLMGFYGVKKTLMQPSSLSRKVL